MDFDVLPRNDCFLVAVSRKDFPLQLRSGVDHRCVASFGRSDDDERIFCASAVAFNAPGTCIVAGARHGASCLFDVSQQSAVGRPIGHSECIAPVSSVAFFDTSSSVFCGASFRENALALCDVRLEASVVKRWTNGLGSGVYQVLPIGEWHVAAANRRDDHVNIWDLRSFAISYSIERRAPATFQKLHFASVVHRDRFCLVGGDADGSIFAWDLVKNESAGGWNSEAADFLPLPVTAVGFRAVNGGGNVQCVASMGERQFGSSCRVEECASMAYFSCG